MPVAWLCDSDPTHRTRLMAVLFEAGYQVRVCAALPPCCLARSVACPQAPHEPCADLILAHTAWGDGDALGFIATQRARGCRCRHIALMADEWPARKRRLAAALGVHTLARPVFPGQVHQWLDEITASEEAAQSSPPNPPVV